jgi:hypothetical protein
LDKASNSDPRIFVLGSMEDSVNKKCYQGGYNADQAYYKQNRSCRGDFWLGGGRFVWEPPFLSIMKKGEHNKKSEQQRDKSEMHMLELHRRGDESGMQGQAAFEIFDEPAP